MANIFKAKSLISRTGVFSNEVLSPNLVYNTGDQNVSGIKNFYSRPTVNGTGVLLSGEAASLPTTIVYTTGDQNISGNKTFNNTLSVGTISSLSGSTSIEIKGLNNAYNFAGSDNGGAVTIRGGSGINYGGDVNLYAGKAGNLDYKGSINLIGSEITINQHNTSAGRNVTIWKNGVLFGTTTPNVSIGQDSVNVTNNFNISGVPVLPASYATITNLASTGSTLTNNITALSGLFTGFTGNLDSTYATDSQLFTTGSTLDTKINTLSGVSVLTYGNQNITGNKTFINNLEVQGTGIFNALDLSNISEFNFSGTNINLISGNVNVSGQIYISGNPVLTGVNLSSYATTANLASTGSTLQTNINNLSGVSVLTFGNQNISGIKTFEDSIKTKNIISTDNENLLISGYSSAMVGADINIIPGSTSFSRGKINLTAAGDQIDGNINLKGNIDINDYGGQFSSTSVYPSGLGHKFTIYKSGISDYGHRISFKSFEVNQTGVHTLNKTPIYSDGQIYISGNAVLTGVDLSSYATITNLALTGLNLSNSIDSLSGLFTGYTGNLDATFASDIQLANTGSNLDTKINNLSGVTVLTYGNQTISGNKTFTNNVEIISPVSGMYGTGNLLNALNVRGFASVNADLSSLTGLITISGSGISGTSPGQFSVGGLLIGQNEGGGYLGRTNIRENSWEVVSGSIANIWISGETDRNWRDIAMSSDGKIQTALASDVVFSTPGKIYISNDYGKIWKEINILNQWQGIAMSSDGKIQTAITYDNTYVSHNYGVDWEIKPSGVGGFDISVSSDGRIQGVVKGSNAYISYDYGNTWNIKSPNVFASPVNIKLSSDGRIQVINGSDGFYGVGDWGYIHISYDYGNTWKQLNTEVGAIYRDIAISADGRIIAAAHINGPISMSYDYGTTWINKATNITISHIYGITMSADGRTIVAAIHNSAIPTNKIYISTDYGNTWQYKSDLYANGNDRTQSIAMSSDGRIITNVYDYGKIWTSYASTLSPNSINVLGSITAHDNVNISGNLNVTGNILLSGNPVLTGVDLSSYATTTNLASTGLTLDTKINTLSGSSVLLYGDQNISGNKTFINNITVSGTGTFNAIDLDNIDNLSLSGVDVTLTNSIVNVAGNIFISGNPVLTGVNLSSYATTSNLANTGSTLDTKIDNLSGYVTGANATFASITNLANTGSTLDTKINNLSGYINSTSSNIVFTTGNQIISGFKTFVEDTTFGDTGQGDFLVISGNNFTVYGSGNFTSGLFVSGSPVLTGSSTLYATTANLALTGSTLQTNINNLSNTYATITNVALTGSTLSTNIASTGSTLQTNINNLSNTYATITNLALTGSTLATNLASTGSTLQTNINNLSNTYATITNVALTGSTLVNNITSLSGLFTGYTGTLDATYATDLQLLNTGITLNTTINNLSGYVNSTSSNIVFTTGNQNIGGNKTFTGVATFSGQEVNLVDTALNLSGLGDMTFSGTNINFINSPVFISGTNLRVAGDVLGNNLVYNTGSQIISGIKTFATGVNISGNVGIGTITPAAKLHIAGPPALLNTTMEDILYLQRPFNAGVSFGSRAVFKLGRHSADGSQSHTRLDIALRSGSDTSTNINAPEINVMTLRADGKVGIGTTTPNERLTVIGNVNVSGNLNVTGNSNIRGTLDVTGLVVSGLGAPFILKSASNGNSVYFDPLEAGQQGVLYANRITINSISGPTGDSDLPILYNTIKTTKVLKFQTSDGGFGVLNRAILDSNGNFGIGSGISSVPSRFYVSGNSILQGDLTVSGTLTTNQRPFVNGTGVLLSGEAAQVDLSTTVRTTGDQTVSGIKDFQSVPLVSGREVYYQKNIVYFTGNNFTPDSNLARTFEYVLTGLAGASATLNAPINMSNGENIVIKIKQSPSGSNNMQFNAAYKFPGGVSPSLTLTPSKADIYTALKIDSNFYSTYVKDFID